MTRGEGLCRHGQGSTDPGPSGNSQTGVQLGGSAGATAPAMLAPGPGDPLASDPLLSGLASIRLMAGREAWRARR